MHYNPTKQGDRGTHVYSLVRGTGPQGLQFRISPASVLYGQCPTWVVFNSMEQSLDGWCDMGEVTAVKSEWLLEVAGHVFEEVAGVQ